MTSDTERREVAARLRELEPGVLGTFIPTGELAENILKAIDYGRSGAMTPYGCLADLIEPSEPKVKCVAEVKVDGERLERLVHDAAVELTGIDRDALLALADEAGRSATELLKANDLDSNRKRRSMRREHAQDLMAASSRIRKALGGWGDEHGEQPVFHSAHAQHT